MQPLRILMAALLLLTISITIMAQDDDNNDGFGDGLRLITPGQTIPGYGPTRFTDQEVQGNGCFPPLPFQIGQTIYVKPGVNIRNNPTVSGGLVWNTIYSDMDENVPATVEEGPVCADGYNWWRISGIAAGNPGWVAEGRPDRDGRYLVYALPGEDLSCDPFYNIAVGKTVELLYNLRVRRDANPDADTQAVASAGTMARVVGGPVCVRNYLWWEVEVEVVGYPYRGWMAEGGDNKFWMVPDDVPSFEDGTLCANPLSFTAGQRVNIRYNDDIPKTLRSTPGTDSPELYRLLDGVPMIILEGTVCSNNLNWWKVRVLSTEEVVGWVAEGSSGVGYWIKPLVVPLIGE